MSNCGVCGTTARQPFRAPRPEMTPDLDFRPGEPARSTLRNWVRVCSECGAAAPDLSTVPPSAAVIVRSVAYTTCEGSAETKPFRQWAMLCPPSDVPNALLQAAWAADDTGHDAEAAALRRQVAALTRDTKAPRQACQRLDALRRAGAFDDAKLWANDLDGWAIDESTAAVIAFQRARIAARDAGRYLLSAALRPPAHAPHVSHGKRQRSGLLARVFRGRLSG